MGVKEKDGRKMGRGRKMGEFIFRLRVCGRFRSLHSPRLPPCVNSVCSGKSVFIGVHPWLKFVLICEIRVESVSGRFSSSIVLRNQTFDLVFL